MKAHHKRIRVFRSLAIAGCLAGLAVPTTAGAMLIPDSPHHLTKAQSQQPYSLPSNFHSEVQSTVQPYSPPSRFRTEVQTPTAGGQTALALRRSAPNPAVVRQFETVTSNDGRTLAIVFAAVAIALALCAIAYSTIRVAQARRSGLGSGSH
jgi:hypothetical protein